ncbi:MAG TPA: outer membrane beta-barrel protein [Kiritimatiellia bacterium]|nr:outer membrane beta-barrel protein [Kiritimatiellia bacterium]HSA18909.1 outer membrane beta-barrel protein [Kiritimatiellia bacterium]
MKRTAWVFIAVGLMMVCGEVAQALEGVKPYQVINRLRLEYDDNIYQEETDKNDSIKIIEEIEIMLNYRLEQSFLSLRYRPSFVWWSDREPDDTDLNHEFDLIANHTFTPRLALSLVDTFRRGEQPELTDRDVVVREKDDFIYNTANGTLSYMFRPQTRLDVAGRYILMRYDEDAVSDTDDFDLLVGGLTLRHQLVQETAVLGELRIEDVDYEGPDRGSATLSAGAGVEHSFSQNLLGMLHGGYQNKEYNDNDLGSDSSPYADLALTYLPTPATRLSLGGGYSLFETDVYPFANQTRARVYASLAHDFTARISFYLSGAYSDSEYDAEDSIEADTVTDGNEQLVLVSARATYQLNRSNWLEAGWQYQDFTSDLENTAGDSLRESYDRNRLHLGWKLQF